MCQEYAFSQYPRCIGGADCMTFARSDILFMGYSVRSETMRYTEWRYALWLFVTLLDYPVRNVFSENYTMLNEQGMGWGKA